MDLETYASYSGIIQSRFLNNISKLSQVIEGNLNRLKGLNYFQTLNVYCENTKMICEALSEDIKKLQDLNKFEVEGSLDRPKLGLKEKLPKMIIHNIKLEKELLKEKKKRDKRGGLVIGEPTIEKYGRTLKLLPTKEATKK